MIFESERGLEGSSASTSFLIRSFTTNDETFSPRAESTPEFKKYFIGNRPRGVSMYLLLTTLEMVD